MPHSSQYIIDQYVQNIIFDQKLGLAWLTKMLIILKKGFLRQFPQGCFLGIISNKKVLTILKYHKNHAQFWFRVPVIRY